MKNWMLKIVLKNFMAPVVDSIIQIMERLAQTSETTIDDVVVEQLKIYRDVIISFLLEELDDIIRAQKKI